ncbi:MAG TPA: uracil-DNA glycosylase, partial [Thermomicrobiaceae bacterium]|nr:uracil-DNA glycosylase [Thermomicrobiaceae bacterium]
MEAERTKREAALAALAARWADDPAIAAARDGSNLVLGAGNPLARLVLIGEAPGGQEEKAGRPFVGPAGKLLDEALAEAGLRRDEIWITNVVKFRPTSPGVGQRKRNRAPTRTETQLFLPWLREELALVEPKALVC